MAGFRRMKERIRTLLRGDDWQDGIRQLEDEAGTPLVGPLFSLLLDPDEIVRWRAVTALGAVVASMADTDMESARIVMRRFMWHMNEESGNIGWGIPESMGETMARHPRLAEEFHTKLASYVQCPDCLGDDNYMDHPPLRLAVYWGLGRLAQVRPQLVQNALPELEAAVQNEDSPGARAAACWAIGRVGTADSVSVLRPLVEDATPVTLFRNGRLEDTTLGAVAREAVDALAS
jgi:HEAT repeat protein